MIAQQKILRVFKIIRLLKQRPGRTIPQLAQLLNIDKRSVYRYLELLEEIGYLFDIDDHHRYYLFEDETAGRPTFTEEESEVMRQALAGLAPSHPLLGSIRQKLFLASSLVPLADGLVDVHQGRVVQRLAEALRDGRQVQLIRYQSPNSNIIADRLVEPLSFSDDYATLNFFGPKFGNVRYVSCLCGVGFVFPLIPFSALIKFAVIRRSLLLSKSTKRLIEIKLGTGNKS